MEYTEPGKYLRENGDNIRGHLRTRTYKPQPVRRAETPKPDGGARNLGVPTVTDRFVRQAEAGARADLLGKVSRSQLWTD